MQKIIQWFKNYWYYYKIRVIVAAFLLVVVTVCVVQCSTLEKYDVYITYAGPDNISSQIDGVRAAVRSVYTTKEEKAAKGISVRDIVWVNGEIATQYIKDGVYFDPSLNQNNEKLLYNEVASGNSFIYILDRQQYERLKGDGVFAPLSDVFGVRLPEGAIDEYGVDFKSTGFYKYFDVFSEWKGDLVICLRSGTLSESLINRLKGSGAYERSYKLHKQIFMDIVQFTVD